MRVSEGYTDKPLTKACDFSLPVRSDLTLYAKWATKSQPYAILYKDGLLSLQAGPDTDPSHGEVLGKWAWDGSSRPWYDKLWRSGNTAEVDFVFEQDGRIIPVEVKSADNTMAKSYRLFCKRHGITRGFKLSLKNAAVNVDNNGCETVSLPLYMAWKLSELARRETF